MLIEVRVREITEFLMYLLRFYSYCNLPKNERIKIIIKFSGLADNFLKFSKSCFKREMVIVVPRIGLQATRQPPILVRDQE